MVLLNLKNLHALAYTMEHEVSVITFYDQRKSERKAMPR